MSEMHGERIARLEAQYADVRQDFNDHMAEARLRSNRVHELEKAVSALLNFNKDARRREELQYRRLELRIQWLSVAIALGALMLAIALAVTHH